MNERFRLKITAFANGNPCREAGAYIKDFDAEGYPGRGSVLLTWDAEDAKHFNTRLEAYEFWQTPCKSEPIRSDGRPNRPLTAYNVSVELLASHGRQA